MKTSNSIIRGLAFKTGVALIALAGAAQMAQASNLYPYTPPGTPNSATYSFLSSGGDVIAYFASASAGDTDYLGLYTKAGATLTQVGSYQLDNQTSVSGASFNFGSITAGTELVFALYDQSSGNTFYSDSGFNTDGKNHIYSTSYDANATPNFGASIPSGTYVAFEDLLNGGDNDYNDLAFVFQNVVTPGQYGAVPEPTTVVAGALLLLPFGVSTLRILRNRKMVGR